MGVNHSLGAGRFEFSSEAPAHAEPSFDGSLEVVLNYSVHVVTAGIGGALGKGKPEMTKKCRTRNTEQVS